MKKALALVLALVLALSLGVSAFATDPIVIYLKELPESTAEVVDITENQLGTDPDYDYGTSYLVGPEGGTFYVTLDGSKEFKDIVVSGTGIVSAKLVDYDPDTMTGADTLYRVDKAGVEYDLTNDQDVVAEVQAKAAFQTGNKTYKIVYTDGSKVDMNSSENEGVNNYLALDKANTLKSYVESMKDVTGWENVKALEENLEFDNSLVTSYDYNKALAEALNTKYRTTKFAAANYNENNIYVIELTVESNYSAAYKTGTVKVNATEVTRDSNNKITKKTAVTKTINIVSDVAIFEYEMVKYAGKNDVALVVGAKAGYSDYLQDGYYGDKYDDLDLRYDYATVVSTTEFRVLRENEWSLEVEAGGMTVKVSEVGASQKGVNFEYDKGNKTYRVATNGIVKVYDEDYLKTYGLYIPQAVEFGFYGDQTIASDFEIDVDLGMTAYELREFFGEKVEEEDVITYYILKNGEEFAPLTVDYMTMTVNGVAVDIDDDLELTLEGKAGDTLGHYSIVLEAPAAEVEENPSEEENPNTGAEPVIGVVAAMAVVSVVAAAAVSLKK